MSDLVAFLLGVFAGWLTGTMILFAFEALRRRIQRRRLRRASVGPTVTVDSFNAILRSGMDEWIDKQKAPVSPFSLGRKE